MSSQAGISSCRAVSSASGGHDSELLLAREGLLAQRVPALVEAALVLVRPLRRHVVRRVRRARREVHEERLVGHQRLLLAHPLDRLVGHVLGEVVALLGRLLRLDRRRALVDGRVVLVRLAADEAVEVLEAAAAGRPGIERAHRARLPHRHLVALAELRRRVAVQLQRLRQRRAGVGADRVVPGRRGRELGDDPHPDRVVVAARSAARPASARTAPSCGSGCTSGRSRPAARRSASRTARRTRSTRRSRRRRAGRRARSARRPAAAAARSAGTTPPDPWRRTGASPRTAGPGSAGRHVRSGRSLSTPLRAPRAPGL